MSEFHYQLRRITWIIHSERTDQYGHRDDGPNAEEIIHGVYASHKEAYSHLDDFTVTWGWQNMNRMPKEATDKYWRSQVTQRDEVLATGPRADVTMIAMGLKDN